MKKKQALIAAACAVVCVGGLAAGIFFAQKKKNAGGDEMAYVMSVSSMNRWQVPETGRCGGICRKLWTFRRTWRAGSKRNHGKSRR